MQSVIIPPGLSIEFVEGLLRFVEEFPPGLWAWLWFMSILVMSLALLGIGFLISYIVERISVKRRLRQYA